MLPSRNLDNQTFEEIIEYAVGRIPQLCPQWTNHNPSDPGITLVELLAWYKEMQQFHMNRCTDDIKSKLLALAGGDIRPASAARCGVRLLEGEGHYPILSQLKTPEGITFELLEEMGREEARIAACFVDSGGPPSDVTAMLRRQEAGVQPFAFGAETKTQFIIALDALPRDSLRLWFEVRQPRLTPRNPFGENSRPPRVIRWLWEGRGEAEVLSDETYALSQSGYITFAVPEGLKKVLLWGTETEEAWCLRAVLEDPGCEETVWLTAVEAGRCQAAQQETWSQSRLLTVPAREDCIALFDDALAAIASFTIFLRTPEGWQQIEGREAWRAGGGRGVILDSREASQDGQPNLRMVCSDPIHYRDLFHDSTGLPDQTITLDLGGRQALPDRFCLICDTFQEDGSIRPAVWRCVEDLYASGPRDRVFLYDPLTQTIRFGDGRGGAVVPRGENAIFLADLVLSECAGGNIPEGERLRFIRDGRSVWSTAASGGMDRETIWEASARFLRRLENPHRCVAAADYETEARRTPGLRVASARAIPGFDPLEPTGTSRHPVVTVVVIPANQEKRPLPDERFLAAVQAHLDRYRPIGTVVRVVAPRYIGITVSAELRTVGQASLEGAWEAVEDCLTVRPGGRSIGDRIAHHEVSMALQQLPGVQAVRRLQLYFDGTGCTETGMGDVLLPRNAVAYLKDCVLTTR